jgi:hypothetical protein
MFRACSGVQARRPIAIIYHIIQPSERATQKEGEKMTNGILTGGSMDTATTAALVFFCLFLMGVLYNIIIGKYERYMEQYVALEVVGGVVFTLAGFGLLAGWRYAGIALLCFAASGAPMLVGSVVRHAAKNKAAIDEANHA